MVRLTRIYTKTGDAGETALGNGERVSKASLRVAAMGSVDEANALIGVARLEAAKLPQSEPDEMLGRIQNELFDLGADLCVPGEVANKLRVTPAQIERLEREIDRLNADLAPLTSFVLPGGASAAAFLQAARAVVRRAEREGWALAAAEAVSADSLRYLNRLSDHLFVLARWINAQTGVGDVLWRPGEGR